MPTTDYAAFIAAKAARVHPADAEIALRDARPVRHRGHAGMRAATYRQLRADDVLPDGEPKRYRDGRGYIRLRWLVGPQEYIEVYEHRLVAGLPDADVHHCNEAKDDNDAGNLRPLRKSEHAREHGGRRYPDRRPADAVGRLSLSRALIAAAKVARKLAREAAGDAFWREVAAGYQAGVTTSTLAAKYGRDASVISRQLRARGIQMRTSGESNRIPLDESEVVRRLRQPGARAQRIAAEFGVSSIVIHRIRREHGIPAARPGRPAANES